MPQRTKTSPIAPNGVYLFTGEDEFRKRLSLERFKKKLIGDKADAFDYESFYGKQSRADDIIRSLQTLPLLAKRKLVVLKEPESLSKEDKDRLLNYLKNPHNAKGVLLLSARRGPSGDDGFISAVSKTARVIDFKPLEPDDISAWIVKEFGERGKKISRRMAALICDAAGHDLGQASFLAEQICTFACDREKITDEDVTRFTGEVFSEASAFKFLDYINDKDINRSLQILKVMLRTGNNPSKVIGLLGWHITRLITVKRLLLKKISRAEMLPYFRVGSYTLNRLISQAENFTLKQLKRQLDMLLDTDLRLKRSGLKPEFLLEMLVVKLGCL